MLLSACAARADTSSIAYQADPAHDGRITLSPGFVPPLRQIWSRDLGGHVSYPIIVNGTVFVTAGNNSNYGTQLYALDLGTGATIWQKPLGGIYYWSNLSYDNGQLIVSNFDGVVRAYRADRTGKPIWTAFLSILPTAPTASGGSVFSGGPNLSVTTLKEKKGAVAWTSPVNGSTTTPAVDDTGGVYFGYPCQYYKFAQATGQKLWNNQGSCHGGGDAMPIYFDNRVFVRDWSSGDWILDAASGGTIGTFQSDQSPAFWQSVSGQQSMMTYLYRSGDTPLLSSIDLGSGATNWTFHADRFDNLITAPLVINDMVAVGTTSGIVDLLDAATGKKLWSANVGAPILDNNENTGIAHDGDGFGRPMSGLGAGENVLLVPATHLLVAFSP